jgi:hypothetical protein
MPLVHGQPSLIRRFLFWRMKFVVAFGYSVNERDACTVFSLAHAMLAYTFDSTNI